MSDFGNRGHPDSSPQGDASPQLARKIPETLFGIFLRRSTMQELVAYGQSLFRSWRLHTPSNIDPWSIIGDDSSVFVATDRTSCFSRNIVSEDGGPL
uniref:Uncharacterized protein n=1 Tax=Zea mays TaxID=4577 RepID=A0A804RST3_MAIZE